MNQVIRGKTFTGRFVPPKSGKSKYMGCVFSDSKLVLNGGSICKFDNCSFRGSTKLYGMYGDIFFDNCSFTGDVHYESTRGSFFGIADCVKKLPITSATVSNYDYSKYRCSIYRIKNSLEKLEFLNVKFNEFPVDTLADLEKLKKLIFLNCELNFLPDDLSWIKKLDHLTLFDTGLYYPVIRERLPEMYEINPDMVLHFDYSIYSRESGRISSLYKEAYLR